jgi:hypothetical protein
MALVNVNAGLVEAFVTRPGVALRQFEFNCKLASINNLKSVYMKADTARSA